jgi:hypothetical protein
MLLWLGLRFPEFFLIFIDDGAKPKADKRLEFLLRTPYM